MSTFRKLIRYRPKGKVRWLISGGVIVLLLASVGTWVWLRVNPTAKVVAGVVPLDPIPVVSEDFGFHREPQITEAGAGVVPKYSRSNVRGRWPPDGKHPGPALHFSSEVDDGGGLQFVLILGSDARSGNPSKSRSDSIHILAIDPKARAGTILGIPRDSWVDVPGYGKQKINQALFRGGPQLAVKTVRNLTGLPIQYYVLTAFDGFRAIANDLDGIDAYVPYDMSDRNSGAYFQKGWHRMRGSKALAFTRNRHVPAGDFARQENQGRLLIDSLKNFRARTSTTKEVETWVKILLSHTKLDMSLSEALRLGVLARVTAASNVTNVVAPGSTGTAGGQSVVFLNQQAHQLFADVRADGIVNGSYPSFGPAHPRDQEQQPPPPSPSQSPSPLVSPLPVPAPP